MGVDIYGWVEIRESVDNTTQVALSWEGLLDINLIVERSYGMFGSLFGVRNEDGFAPVAAHRGIPFDASTAVRRDSADGSVSPSWMGLDDFDSVDWEEVGSHPVERVVDAAEYRQADRARDQYLLDKYVLVQVVEEEYVLLKYWRRRELLTPGWKALREMMRALAIRFGHSGVRLVVWFDSE